MERIEFTAEVYGRLMVSGYNYVEVVATGDEIESSPGYFRKVVAIVPYKELPTESKGYILGIQDSEVLDILEGTDTDIFMIQKG